jgi:hypothetical protein
MSPNLWCHPRKNAKATLSDVFSTEHITFLSQPWTNLGIVRSGTSTITSALCFFEHSSAPPTALSAAFLPLLTRVF